MNSYFVRFDESPLTQASARFILNALAEHFSERIRWSNHVKQRMLERQITTSQIFTLLKNKRSIFREGPYQESNGDWKFNLKGITYVSL